jgi:predicted HAD superfamily Cof-like phosphohydrolase
MSKQPKETKAADFTDAPKPAAVETPKAKLVQDPTNEPNPLIATEAWFVASGQMTKTPERNLRQIMFYTGMQFEELGEKIEALFGEPTAVSKDLALTGNRFKQGDYDAKVRGCPNTNWEAALDADLDLIWVSVGGGKAQGADVSGAYGEVARANWAKFPGGVVTRDAVTGKVIKPDGWTPPDLSTFLLKEPV